MRENLKDSGIPVEILVNIQMSLSKGDGDGDGTGEGNLYYCISEYDADPEAQSRL